MPTSPASIGPWWPSLELATPAGRDTPPSFNQSEGSSYFRSAGCDRSERGPIIIMAARFLRCARQVWSLTSAAPHGRCTGGIVLSTRQNVRAFSRTTPTFAGRRSMVTKLTLALSLRYSTCHVDMCDQ